MESTNQNLISSVVGLQAPQNKDSVDVTLGCDYAYQMYCPHECLGVSMYEVLSLCLPKKP